MTLPDYTFEAFSALLEDGGLDPRMLEASRAAHASFHEVDASGVLSRRSAHAAADRGARVWIARGNWDVPDRSTALRPRAVLYYYPGTLNVGGGELLEGGFLTYAAVRATDTRRGLLTELMGRNLDSMVTENLPVAVLRASEGGIYGRFGFAPIYRCANLSISRHPAFRLTEHAAHLVRDSGWVEEVSLPWLLPRIEHLSAEIHAQERMSIDRQAGFSDGLYMLQDRDELDPTIRAAVHLDSSGHFDGFVTFKVVRAGSERTAYVFELLGSNAVAELALWEFVGRLDLVSKIEATDQPLDGPLVFAATDPRSIRLDSVTDYLWARILDPVEVLQTRAYSAAARGAKMGLRFTVTDPQGYADGTFELRVGANGASVSKSSGLSEIEMTVSALASLALGGESAHILAGAGLIIGANTETLDYIDALFTPVGTARCTGDF